MNKSKGFLFTIAAIFFASTLVFFVQGFYESNLAIEREIISSASSLNIVSLNEDLSTDIEKLFGMNFDVNLIEKSLNLSGRMDSSSSISNYLSEYSSFLSTKFFTRSSFDKTLDISTLTDGKAEFFVGEKLNLDYNYGNSLALFSQTPDPFDSFDINFQTTGTLTSYEWSASTGSANFPISIKYSDDSNAIIISDSIDNNSLSYLNLIYPDGNTIIEFGRISYIGADYNSGFVIKSKSNQVINYALKSDYTNLDLFSVKINSILSIKSTNIDSNTMLTLLK
jgi:hypothetical protein